MNYTSHLIKKIRYKIGILLSLGTLFAISANGTTPDSTFAKKPQPFSNIIYSLASDSTSFKASQPYTSFIKEPLNDIMNNEDDIRAGLLYDVNRKTIIWEKDMNYAYPVASLTKMMVALLAIEDIKAGKANWTDEVVVKRIYYKGKGRHKKKYSVQVPYTLDDLIRLAMISSNNEATVWIGTKLGGGELPPFIKRMNEKCMTLGMEHTFFSNPSGLPAVSGELDNSSSPNDLLILALELIKHREILDITKIDYVTIKTGTRSNLHRNHNGLVIQYPNEVDGLKTGYTRNAKFCLVATSNHGGHRLISIVLGAQSPSARNSIVADMMNNYYNVLKLGSLGSQPGDTRLASIISDSLTRNSLDFARQIIPEKNDTDTQAFRKVYVKTKKVYTVKKGESIYGIADKFDCYASEIKKWNKLRSSHLKYGQKLVIYKTEEKTIAIDSNNPDSNLVAKESTTGKTDSVKLKTKSAKPSKSTNEELKAKFVYHIVQPGDTLWNIAQRYSGTTVEKLKKVNKINNAKGLRPGTKLKIQVGS